MNYYERHLGDYARNAGHLTMLEHGAYTLLLDRYYTTDQPIPAEQAHRLCRARSAEEIAAVDVVLSEFFILESGAYRNRRADEELAKALVRIEAARDNGRKGGRPKARPIPVETQQKPNGLGLGCPAETQVEAHQAPSNHLSKKEQKPSVRQAAPETDPQFELAWSAYPKRGGGNSKPDALKAWNARLKAGEETARLFAGVIRYAKFIRATGKEGTEFVKQAARFFGPGKHYLDDWPLPVLSQNAPSKTFTAMQTLEGMKTNGLDYSGASDRISNAGVLELGPSTSGGRTPSNGSGVG